MDMFMGNMPGVIGEVSKLALLIGAAYLVFRGVISLRIPVIYIATTAVFGLLLGVKADYLLQYLLSGGLILGAFFMATDYASSPINKKAQIVYAVGCGLLTVLIREIGGYPEGVSYSILLMNVATPLFERVFKPAVFGVGGAKK
jgi:electron transport complex protein RnfD